MYYVIFLTQSPMFIVGIDDEPQLFDSAEDAHSAGAGHQLARMADFVVLDQSTGALIE
ncbi:hypothetical protein LCGC14_1294160 [marine sediment metagenome]|uniref:Uncharacterized protein n=1 Tax=marine sediment metagenome TaxID=412755 RepID=A0A0F9KRS5_9ZZZZ